MSLPRALPGLLNTLTISGAGYRLAEIPGLQRIPGVDERPAFGNVEEAAQPKRHGKTERNGSPEHQAGYSGRNRHQSADLIKQSTDTEEKSDSSELVVDEINALGVNQSQ